MEIQKHMTLKRVKLLKQRNTLRVDQVLLIQCTYIALCMKDK